MVFEHGIPAQSIHVLTNSVDMRRFTRRPPLPPKPRRALIFSNNAEEETWVKPIRAACENRGITLEIGGSAAGRPIDLPEHVLAEYDLVFAKARCAIESLAVGCAVIVCDAQGLAGMVTRNSLESMRQLNFGGRTLRLAVTTARIQTEIDRYEPADAAAVCDRIRLSADIDLLVDQYAALYDELCERGSAGGDDMLAVSRSLSQMATHLYAHVGTEGPLPSPPLRWAGLLRRVVRRLSRRRRDG